MSNNSLGGNSRCTRASRKGGGKPQVTWRTVGRQGGEGRGPQGPRVERGALTSQDEVQQLERRLEAGAAATALVGVQGEEGQAAEEGQEAGSHGEAAGHVVAVQDAVERRRLGLVLVAVGQQGGEDDEGEDLWAQEGVPSRPTWSSATTETAPSPGSPSRSGGPRSPPCHILGASKPVFIAPHPSSLHLSSGLGPPHWNLNPASSLASPLLVLAHKLPRRSFHTLPFSVVCTGLAPPTPSFSPHSRPHLPPPPCFPSATPNRYLPPNLGALAQSLGHVRSSRSICYPRVSSACPPFLLPVTSSSSLPAHLVPLNLFK